MRKILETVVSEGGRKKAQIEGYRIGGKRQRPARRLPRSANRYIGSFIGFAPADDPQGSSNGNSFTTHRVSIMAGR